MLAAVRVTSSRGALLLDSYHLDGCAQERCSNGITLGVTPWQVAQTMVLKNNPPNVVITNGSVCWDSVAKGQWIECLFLVDGTEAIPKVNAVALMFKEQTILLGDVINWLGSPVTDDSCNSVLFKERVYVQFDRPATTPWAIVKTILYTDDDAWHIYGFDGASGNDQSSWKGFTRRRKCGR